jgi:hypothetical protein
VKEKYKEENENVDKNCKIRLFFGGGEILDNHMLFQHNVKDDYTIQLIKKIEE